MKGHKKNCRCFACVAKRKRRRSPRRKVERRHVRGTRRSRRVGGRKIKHIRSRVIGARHARRPVRARPRRGKSVAKISRRNPAVEYLVEVYLTGRRFAYYQDDKNLTTERGHATRFKNQYLARQKANLVRDRAPARAEWVRVIPA